MMPWWLYNIVIKTGYLFLAVNILVYLWQSRREDTAYRILTVYMVAMGIVQFIVDHLNSIDHPNLFMSHYYFNLQFLILSFFYYTILSNRLQRKVILGGIGFVVSALGIQYSFYPELYSVFNLFEIFITSFLIVIYSLFYFYNSINRKGKYYYLNIGIFAYLFGSTVLFLSGPLVITLGIEVNLIVWQINASIYAIYQALIMYEWWNIYKQNKAVNNERIA